MRVSVIEMVVGALGTVPRRLEKKTGGTRKNQYHSDHSTAKFGWSAQKSPGDLRRLSIT